MTGSRLMATLRMRSQSKYTDVAGPTWGLVDVAVELVEVEAVHEGRKTMTEALRPV